MTETKPLSFDSVRSYPLADRKSKVDTHDFAHPWSVGGTLDTWLNSLPHILAAEDLLMVRDRIVAAFFGQHKIILAMGAHPIKVGLNPVIIDLMERGVISALAMNGACIIHDTELAMAGKTSEDVAAELNRGNFGMAEETGRFLNQAITEGAGKGMGLGESVGNMLLKEAFSFDRYSLLARARELDIPVTVHVAVGTDIIHFHPLANGAHIGATSHRDFRIFCRLVSEMDKGVLINLGSAVILPEVFLKALSVVRNLGHEVKDITTINMDFIRQYRPMTNVVHRPTQDGGKGFSLVGHHEIMFPLLAAALIEGIEEKKKKG
ncbi:conserved hypothetical protein [delta proteobacterium NaphS2]|nr:conserved hypothetical protein [delta proteobacterium NaphS2]